MPIKQPALWPIKHRALQRLGLLDPAQARRRLDDEDAVFNHGLEALLSHMPKTFQDNMRNTMDVWRAFAGEVNRWRPSWIGIIRTRWRKRTRELS